MKRYVVLLGLTLVVLFYISSMSYEEQTIVPTLRNLLENKPFYHLLSQIEVTYWGRTISVETRGYYYFVEFLIRKGIHFVGFGLISILFYIFYRKCNFTLPTILAILTTFLLACLDELRQTFVDGRTGIFDDVILDTFGAITFIFLFKIAYGTYQLLFKERLPN